MISIFNVYSGEHYMLKQEELNNIQEGEIPLKKTPKTSCKRCYGRGHIGYDKLRYFYQPCVVCVEKQIIEQYENQILFNCMSYKKDK